jgi:ribonucleoside-triphosphate reductase
MGVFIGSTRREIINELKELELEAGKINKVAEKRLRRCVEQSMQGIVYNLNTMHSRAGSQVPLSSVNISSGSPS